MNRRLGVGGERTKKARNSNCDRFPVNNEKGGRECTAKKGNRNKFKSSVVTFHFPTVHFDCRFIPCMIARPGFYPVHYGWRFHSSVVARWAFPPSFTAMKSS